MADIDPGFYGGTRRSSGKRTIDTRGLSKIPKDPFMRDYAIDSEDNNPEYIAKMLRENGESPGIAKDLQRYLLAVEQEAAGRPYKMTYRVHQHRIIPKGNNVVSIAYSRIFRHYHEDIASEAWIDVETDNDPQKAQSEDA